jgi:beta-barrel assembly-enhancing protease
MFRVIAALAIAGMIAHTQVAHVPERLPGRGVNFYSKQKEAALGAQIAEEIRRNETMLGSDVVHEYVRMLGERLAAEVPGDPITVAFDVIADRSPGPHHEPLTVPGGQVVVRSGLFLAAENEAEFAGMLAHAIAHVAERHGTRSATRGEVVNMASIPLIFMGSWTTPGASAVVPLGFLKFARQHELEADKLAVWIVASAGFDPAGLIEYIGRTQVDNPERKQYSPFPALEERLSALNDAASAFAGRTYDSSGEFAGVRDEVRKVLAERRPRKEPPSLRRKTPEQP